MHIRIFIYLYNKLEFGICCIMGEIGKLR